jgi:hypothetical protein
MDIDKELKEPTFRSRFVFEKCCSTQRADFQLPHTPNCVYARTHAMGQRPAREAQLLVRKFT